MHSLCCSMTTPFASNTSNPSRVAADCLRWDATAAQLVQVYRDACDRPPPTAGTLYELGGERTISEDGFRLSGRAVRSRPTSSDHCSRWPPIRG